MDDRIRRRATVHDVAREAGVSLATVDRVLNGRPGVRSETISRVETAIAALGFTRDLSASLLARARDLGIAFIMPSPTNAFMGSLGEAVARQHALAAADRVRLEIAHFPALDAAALAQKLDALDPGRCDCAVVVATEDEPVRAAVERASRRGIAVVTLVSDLPGSARRHFVGIDNLAAGRTAAALLGRFCGQGRIAVIAGSMHLRDHRERYEGFADEMRRQWPELMLLDPIEGHESDEETGAAARKLLAAHDGITGLYNLGAGNGGLVTALDEMDGRARPRVVAHELTEATRRGLEQELIDVIIDQNPDREVQAAIAAARQLALGGAGGGDTPIEIGIFLKTNLR
jgi:LacI family transcriptional regulator